MEKWRMNNVGEAVKMPTKRNGLHLNTLVELHFTTISRTLVAVVFCGIKFSAVS